MSKLSAGEFEKIASGIYLEGLGVDYKRNVVWFSDVVGGGVHGVTPDGASVGTLNASRMWTGGVMMNEDGSVLSSGQGGIMWNHPDTGKSGWLINEIDGVPVNGINEMVPDGDGGIYFNTVDIEMIALGQTPRTASIYRLTADRKVLKLVDGIRFTNGMMLSADRKRFYCNNTFECTLAFDVQPDLSLTNQRVLMVKEDADGMALDADGNLWLTGFASPFLERIKPDGTRLSRIETPRAPVTQVRFGGADMKDYYITAVSPTGGESLKEGKPLTEKDSYLYRGRSDVAGMPIMPARFTLS